MPQDNTLGYEASGEMGDGEEFMLDATTDVKVTYSAEATSFHVNAGTDNADHIKNQPRLINFSGVISNDLGLGDFLLSLISDGESSPATLYHTQLTKNLKNKVLFSVYIPNVGVINNCSVTRCAFRSDVKLYNSFEVSLELKEIRVPEDASEQPSAETKDVVAKEQTKAAQPTQEVATPANVSTASPVNPTAVAK